MKCSHHLILVFGLCLSLTLPSKAQDIWPGDINNNGIVNGVDLLYLGIAYGSTGTPRDGASTIWQAQPLTAPWTQDFPDGVNYAYADCNGDGTVDELDVEEALEENVELTHGDLTPDTYVNGNPGMAPPLKFVPSTDVIFPGEMFTIDILLGDESFPVGDFYGIALTLSYDDQFLIMDDGIEFETTTDSWIDPTGETESEYLFKEDQSNSPAELAITRIDQQSISGGMGKIGEFSIVIEDIIVGLTIDTFDIRVLDVKMIDVDLNTFAVVPADTFVVIAQDSSFLNSTYESLNPELVNVFPNPISDEFHIQTSLEIKNIALLNVLGQKIPIQHNTQRRDHFMILPEHLSDGIYFLQIYAEEGMVLKKILRQSN
jgi:hypothetical protein